MESARVTRARFVSSSLFATRREVWSVRALLAMQHRHRSACLHMALPPPKRHGSEPTHHEGITSYRARRQRARQPPPAGWRRASASRGCAGTSYACLGGPVIGDDEGRHSAHVRECHHPIKVMCRLLRSRNIGSDRIRVGRTAHADRTRPRVLVAHRARTRLIRLRHTRLRSSR